MKIRTILGVSIVALVLFGVAYLNRYEYFKLSRGEGVEMEFRTNRYTNETDVLGNHGWYVAQTSQEWADHHWTRTHPIPEPAPLPDGAETK